MKLLLISFILLSSLFAHRYYDAATGRFIQIDPKAEKFRSMNPYTGLGNNPLYYTDPDGQEIRGAQEDLEKLAEQTNEALIKLGIKDASVKVNNIRTYDKDGNLVKSYFTLTTVGDGWKSLMEGKTQVTSLNSNKLNAAATKGLIGYADLIQSPTQINFSYGNQDQHGNKTQEGGINSTGVDPTAEKGTGFGVALHEILHSNPNFTGNDVINAGKAFGNNKSNPYHRNDDPAGGYTGAWEWFGLNRIFGQKRIPKVKVPKRSAWQ